MSFNYLIPDDIIFIHDQMIRRYSGSTGIRDMNLLTAAISQIRQPYYETIETKAAALLRNLMFDHPFVDGNKRTACAAFHVFLLINGFDLNISPKEMFTFVKSLFEDSATVMKKLHDKLPQIIVARKTSELSYRAKR